MGQLRAPPGEPRRACPGHLCLKDRRGCLLVVAGFILFVVLYGLLYNYNILFVALQEEFRSSATLTGWLGAMPLSLSLMLAPLVKVAAERFGYRPVSVFGVTAASGGIIVTSFLPSLLPMYATYGMVFGVGAGILSVCTYDLVVMYFPKENTMRAMACACCGTSAGILSFSHPMALVVSSYGWRTLMQLMGALLFAIGMPCVMFYVEPAKSISCCDVNNVIRRKDRVMVSTKSPSPAYQIVSDLSKDDGKARRESEAYYEVPQGICDTSQTHTAVEGTNLKENPQDHEDFVPFSQNQTKSDETKPGDPQWSVDRTETAIMSTDLGEALKPIAMLQRILVVMAYPELWMINFAIILNGIADVFYYVNVISYLISIGFEEKIGVQFIFILAMASLTCRVLLVFVGDYVPFPRIFLLVIVSLTGIGSMFGFLFVRSVAVVYVIAAVIGAFTTCLGNLVTFTLCPEFFGPDLAMETSAVVLFCYGVGYILGSLAGQSIDHTGSYRNALWAFIGMYTASGLMFITAPLYQRYFAPARLVTFKIHREKVEARRERSRRRKGRFREEEELEDKKRCHVPNDELTVFERVSSV